MDDLAVRRRYVQGVIKFVGWQLVAEVLAEMCPGITITVAPGKTNGPSEEEH
jgi:hypothetical protein